MTEKKRLVNKIYKGLMCCLSNNNGPDCYNCPYAEEYDTCENLDRLHLDVLNAFHRIQPVVVQDVRRSDRLIGTFHGICPSCGKVVSRFSEDDIIKYCQKCGQALEWRYEEQPAEATV